LINVVTYGGINSSISSSGGGGGGGIGSIW
jgi:hypothetical protein